MITAPVEILGYGLADIELIRGHTSTLRIYIDSEDGINADDCIDVSHQVSAVTDIEDPVTIAHSLEVSSPGLGRLSFTAGHYMHFLGEEATLVFRMVVQNHRKWQGVIEAVDGETVMATAKGEDEVFVLSNIRRVDLVPHF